MRFITFASVILIASTLNGCSKTGTATPVTNSTSTSVRATQTSKKVESPDTNTVEDQKVKDPVNVKVGVKSDEVVSSKGSNAVVKAIGNENTKDSVILTMKSAAKVVRFADQDTENVAQTEELTAPSTLEAGTSTEGLAVPAVADAATTTYEDPFEGLEVTMYTREQEDETKSFIKGYILNQLKSVEGKEGEEEYESEKEKNNFFSRIAKLIEADDTELNGKYIHNILYSNMHKIMDLKRSKEDAQEKIEKYEAKWGEFFELEKQFDDDRNKDRKEILGQKIKALKDLLVKESVDVENIRSQMMEDEKELGDILTRIIGRLVHRQKMLDKGHEILENIENAEKVLEDDDNAVRKIEELKNLYEIARKPGVRRNDLDKIRQSLKIKLNPKEKPTADFIVQEIAARIEEESVNVLDAENLKTFKGALTDQKAAFNKLFKKDDMKLVKEQMKLTHA